MRFYSLYVKEIGIWRKMGEVDEVCLKSSSTSILVNGSPTSEFIACRGLRQGDPLAPFLFNVVVQGLCGMMRQAI